MFAIVGNAFLFSFFTSWLLTGSGFLICCFVFCLVACSLVEFFSWNYTRYMWANFVPSGVSCSWCSKWCYHFVLASPSLLPFWGNKFMGLYTRWKKFCVREMTVEVGSFSGCPGYDLGNIRVFSYNRCDAICSFIRSMLLAPPVVW